MGQPFLVLWSPRSICSIASSFWSNTRNSSHIYGKTFGCKNRNSSGCRLFSCTSECICLWTPRICHWDPACIERRLHNNNLCNFGSFRCYGPFHDSQSCGRKDQAEDTHAVCDCSCSNIHNRRYSRRIPRFICARHKPEGNLFCSGTLPLRDGRCYDLWPICCNILLASQDDKPYVQRDTWQITFHNIFYQLQHTLLSYVPAIRDAQENIYIPGKHRLGNT